MDLVFAWILDEVAKAGYLSPKAVFIDGTHIKANANTKKQMKEQIPAAARHYAKELMEEVNADREAHGKKPFDEVYDKVTENFPQVEAVVADAAYKTPHICKKVFGDGRVLSTAYKRPQTMKNGHESLCCFFAHICSRPSLLLSTDRVPRQTERGKDFLSPSIY